MPRADDAVGDSAIEAGSITGREIADELRGTADRFDDLSSDPPAEHRRSSATIDDEDPVDDLEHDLQHEDQEEEVWFEADVLAAASTVELGAGPGRLDLDDHGVLARAPGIEAITAAIASPGISLARLPGWPEAGPTGQGLGAVADELIGELRPGDLVLLTGSERGVGRTSLLAQLGDGLALADALLDEAGRPATPVLCASEGGPALWRARSLARFAGVDARVFVEGGRARREPRCAELVAGFSAGPWVRLDERQRFVDPSALGDPDRRAPILAALRRWRDGAGGGAGKSAAGEGEVWPIVIVDPVERLLPNGGDRGDRGPEPDAVITAVHELAELAADEGLIVIASCDLPAEDRARARAVDGCASVRLRAAVVDEQTLALELCHRRLGPRGHGRLRWHRPSGRFTALACRAEEPPEY